MSAVLRVRSLSACLSRARQGDGLDRIDDRLVSGAAAVIAGEMLANCVATGNAAGGQELLGADEHARRAEAALQRVPPLERGLQIGNGAGIRQSFDGFNARTIALHRKNKAAAHHLAVEPHGTGAADAVFAADM